MNSHSDKPTNLRTMLLLVSALVILSCMCSVATGAEQSQPSLISNGDMEAGNPPANWVAEGGATVAADSDTHSGAQSLKISVTNGRATQSFPVKPGTKYGMKFWYKCAPLVGRIYVFVSDGGPSNLTGDLRSEDAWTQWMGEFKTSRESTSTSAIVGLVVYGGNDILVDDVSIVELGPAEDAAPPVNELVKDTPKIPVQEALQSWQALFPKQSYVCWEKSPWDKLAKVALPPAAVKECKSIRLAMGVNEYESVSFVLTNISDKPLDFSVTAKAAGLPITLRQAVWVTTFYGVEVNDALPLLEGKLSIPSGESREIWLTLYSHGVKPGDYSPQVVIASAGQPSTSVSLKVKVYPVTLPDDKPIYTYFWDYVVPEWTGPEMARALVQDMKQHYVSVPVIHPWPTRLEVNPDGTLKSDYKELDSILQFDRALKPKMFVFAWNDALLADIPGYPFFGDKWKALFASYLTGLVSHMKAKGLGYDRFAIIPYDERMDKPVHNMAKLMKEIDPKIQICLDAIGTRSQAEAIAPYVDIWCPDLYEYITPATQYNDKNQNPKLLPKADRFFWTYANPPGGRAQEASPYVVYRLALWKAFQAGMSGFGYWVYSYKTHWNSLNHEDGENWAVVYLANAKDAPAGLSKKELVVPSKRWEATREGVEDYVYLRLLRDRVGKADGKVSPKLRSEAEDILADSTKSVLASPKSSSLADTAKENVLNVLSRFPKGK